MKIVLLFIGLFLGNLSLAQLPQMTRDIVETYMVDQKLYGLKVLKIPVNFNEANPLKNVPDSINDLTIERIDLVYSANKKNPDFDQIGLNEKRTRAFLKKFPAAKNELIAWREVVQNSANNPTEAKELFHGFVIYYRPTPSAETMKIEMDYIDEILGFKESDKSTHSFGSSESIHSDKVEIASPIITPIIKEGEDVLDYSLKTVLAHYKEDCFVIRTIEFYRTNKEMPVFSDSIMRLPNTLGSTYTFTTSGEVSEDKPNNYTYKWAELQKGCKKIEAFATTGLSDFSYSPNFKTDYGVVETVFTRNAEWKNSLIVMDVTGSMSPYIGQTMSWVKERAKSDQVNAFVFFNDGDSKPTSAKKIGSVGGIYMAQNKNFSAVYDQMKYTMQQGGGGDCPENNVEATILGVKSYPDASEIVMVADNWATPRDLALVKNIGKPVHVILCGAYACVNIQYIQLAYDTEGSIHTIEEDMNMAGIKPNKTFQLGNKYFTLINGKIVKAENKY